MDSEMETIIYTSVQMPKNEYIPQCEAILERDEEIKVHGNGIANWNSSNVSLINRADNGN